MGETTPWLTSTWASPAATKGDVERLEAKVDRLIEMLPKLVSVRLADTLMADLEAALTNDH